MGSVKELDSLDFKLHEDGKLTIIKGNIINNKKRNIVQILGFSSSQGNCEWNFQTENHLYGLCDDGSVWTISEDKESMKNIDVSKIEYGD